MAYLSCEILAHDVAVNGISRRFLENWMSRCLKDVNGIINFHMLVPYSTPGLPVFPIPITPTETQFHERKRRSRLRQQAEAN